MELYAEDQGVIFALVALGWCITEVAPEEIEEQRAYEMPQQAYKSPIDRFFLSHMSSIFIFFFSSCCLAKVFESLLHKLNLEGIVGGA